MKQFVSRLICAGLWLCPLLAWSQQPPAPAPAKPAAGAPEVPAAQEPKPGPGETKPTGDAPKPGEVKADTTVAAAVDPSSYVIGAEDVVSISVWREPELSRLYVVRPDGKLSMPLGGDIVAAGVTPAVLNERVIAALSEFMTKPEVMVEIRQVNSKRYYISGEVGRAGPYPLVTPVTMLEALSLAGGLRDFANKKKIVIMRGDERIKFNYAEVIKGKKMEQNIQLKPGDHIIVP
ncbi:MAG: polysaccharide biosynthesis/export family protein [Acidobacteria bacterium]|nr:polysaccharide biosynthesis/export family protein [Acidobacteriota bacterium]